MTAAMALCTTSAFAQSAAGFGGQQGRDLTQVKRKKANQDLRPSLYLKLYQDGLALSGEGQGVAPMTVFAERKNGSMVQGDFDADTGLYLFEHVGEKVTLHFSEKGQQSVQIQMPNSYEATASVYLGSAATKVEIRPHQLIGDGLGTPGPVVNDLCANAIPIGDGGTAYSTIGASTDGPIEGSCEFDGQTYQDIWFVYTASCTGDLTLGTCNAADYDSDLAIYDGTDCGSLVLLGCDDDTPGCAGFTQEFTVPVTAGNAYLVRVGGFSDGDEGSGTLTLSCAGDGGGGVPNDLCADAIPIMDGATPFDTTGANTDGPGDATCEFDGQTYQDIWYTYTATCTGTLTLSTCNTADYDSDLVIYDGTDCNNLVLLGCDDDTPGCAGFTQEFSVPVTQGNAYLIRVGGFSDGDQGTGTLNLSCEGDGGGGDDNDLCTGAIPIMDGCTPFDTTGANTDGPGDVSCQFDGQTYQDIWYTYTATCTGELTVSTCSMADYDTDLVVYDGTDCGNLVLLGCEDDTPGCDGFTSELVVPVVSGNAYLIRVGGFSDGDQGTGTLCISCDVPPDPPANDDCANAIALNANDTVTFSNEEATQDDFGACGDNGGGIPANVWYTVVGTGNTMTASTCNAGTVVDDTRISVYCGECAMLSCVDGNDDNCPAGGPGFASGVSWCSAPGVTYYISVGSFSDTTTKGTIQLDVSDNGVACGFPDGNCVALGACCLDDGSCVVTTEADCGAQGGDYQGDDTSCSSEAIADGGFEAGAFSGNWVESSTNFGTPLCTLGGCGAGGGTGPRSGDWWSWFGGIGAFEQAAVEQTVMIPMGASNLSFWLEIPVTSGNGTDNLDLLVDGNLEWQALESDGPFIGYVKVDVDVSAYADGGMHTIRFDSTNSGAGGAFTNFFVDDVSLAVDTNPCEVCYLIDFETEDDFSTPLGNGQAITTPPEFGNLIALSTTGQAQNENEGLSIFDTDPAGPNMMTDDEDLLVGLGNALIIQETNFPDMTGDFFDTPNDERFGGTIYIDFLAAARPLSIDLIDIDPFPGDQTATVTLTDGSGNARVYDVPTGWTTDISGTGGDGYGTLDLTTLADQPGAFSTATASEDAGFNGADVVQITVFLTSSGAIDNLEFCQ